MPTLPGRDVNDSANQLAERGQSAPCGALARVVALLAPFRLKIFLSLAAMTFTCLGLLALPLLARAALYRAIHLHEMSISLGAGVAIIGASLAGGFWLRLVSAPFQVSHELIARRDAIMSGTSCFVPVGYHRDVATGPDGAAFEPSRSIGLSNAASAAAGVAILMGGGTVMLFLLN